MPNLCILGAGSWGTALAIALANRFRTIYLWSHNPERAASISLMRENTRYLPGFQLSPTTVVSSDIADVLPNAEIVLLVTPSAHLRATAKLAVPKLADSALVVIATKGLEESSLCRMSQVFIQESARPVAVLSGPTFAREVAAGEPAAVVIASAKPALAAAIQQAFATPSLRLYTSDDVTGVELGAALKNVVAIGAGICKGLGLGNNSVAALVTRGLAEISRLAVACGAQQRTLSGLAGLGDLVLTATGDLSRNRHLGFELGNGRTLENALRRMTNVAEGVGTCRAAYQLGQHLQIDMPIITEMYRVLYEHKDARTAIRDLMERRLTTE